MFESSARRAAGFFAPGLCPGGQTAGEPSASGESPPGERHPSRSDQDQEQPHAQAETPSADSDRIPCHDDSSGSRAAPGRCSALTPTYRRGHSGHARPGRRCSVDVPAGIPSELGSGLDKRRPGNVHRQLCSGTQKGSRANRSAAAKRASLFDIRRAAGRIEAVYEEVAARRFRGRLR